MSFYECGLHIDGSQAAYELSQRPEMEQILIDYDNMTNDICGNIPRCYFNYGGKPRSNTDFGHLRYSGDTDNPKWKALRWLIDN